jgi:hypothetical protein
MRVVAATLHNVAPGISVRNQLFYVQYDVADYYDYNNKK